MRCTYEPTRTASRKARGQYGRAIAPERPPIACRPLARPAEDSSRRRETPRRVAKGLCQSRTHHAPCSATRGGGPIQNGGETVATLGTRLDRLEATMSEPKYHAEAEAIREKIKQKIP